jgi:hypothetical protein
MKFWLGIGIFLGVVLIAFAIFVLHITNSSRGGAPEAAAPYAPITDVEFTDSYSSKTGLHTITGHGTVPTACTELSATSTVVAAADASSTDSIRVDLSAAPDTGICLTLPTEADFKLTAKAGADAAVSVYANGALASTTSE